MQLKNGTQIQILPKIYGKTAIDPKNILKMLKSLQEFPSKTFNETSLRTDHMTLLEIFIRLYIEEVQKLIKRT